MRLKFLWKWKSPAEDRYYKIEAWSQEALEIKKFLEERRRKEKTLCFKIQKLLKNIFN